MKKSLLFLFMLTLFVGFSSCSSDDDKDAEREKLERRLESYKRLKAETEAEIIEKTKYCQENEAAEGGYNKCYEGWIAPLERKIDLYNEKIAELEAQL